MTTSTAASGFRPDRAPPNAEEVELIQELRDHFAPELEVLRRRWCNFSHTTGTFFLLRVLRGNGGDVNKAASWYRRFLEKRAKYGLDQIYQTYCDLSFDVACIPGYNNVSQHVKIMGDESTLCTPDGDLVQCDFFGGVNWDRFLTELGVESYHRFLLHLQEIRLAALDRLSRERQHLVKVVSLVDLREAEMPPVEFMEAEAKFRTSITESTGIEIIHQIMLICPPMWVRGAFGIMRPLLPARTNHRVRVLDHTFLKDSEVLAAVGEPLERIGRLRALPNSDDEAGLEGAGRVVPAGRVFERSVQVLAGQQLRWKFCMGRAGGTAADLATSADATDVQFSVIAVWGVMENVVHKVPRGDLPPGLFEVLVPAHTVDAGMGTVSGHAVATCDGVMVLRWSNYHSVSQAKFVLRFDLMFEDLDATLLPQVPRLRAASSNAGW
eukprot:NODE_8092_length_1524_cov_3.976378.p1 GENE.NODE_8092_length_1524_cov_3.976378~~NODE_8092_length_1524_cov_3.976378.p1  ORF type:complete len:438 (+),score=88.28 NODE_8092_length_1524_cov_3.976378:29-1342(+)